MSGPPVSVAIVSWNTRDLLVRCLAALQPDVESGLAEVWVVDNVSADGSAAAARAAAPWAHVLEPGSNLGFGRAVNLVAARSRSPWLVCANADTGPCPGALARLLEAGADSRVGCLAPRLTLPDGRTQHSVYPFPTPAFTLAFNLGRGSVDSRWAERRCLEGSWDPDRPREVPWAIGAFLLLRRQAFEQVGGFDERQWMYAEDLDLGWRLHDGGWVTRYVPAAEVRHESGAATSLAFADGRRARFTRETYAVIARRRGGLVTRWVALVNVLGAAARAGWLAPLALLRRRHRAALRAHLSWLSAHAQGLAPRLER